MPGPRVGAGHLVCSIIMRNLRKLVVMAPLAALTLLGCGAGETPIPEGMDINNPNGKLGAPDHLKVGPPPQGGKVPGVNDGGKLPGAPEGFTLPSGK